jgi:hypothetical protein
MEEVQDPVVHTTGFRPQLMDPVAQVIGQRPPQVVPELRETLDGRHALVWRLSLVSESPLVLPS